MAFHIEVVGGPSKWDLMLALFERKSVRFKLKRSGYDFELKKSVDSTLVDPVLDELKIIRAEPNEFETPHLLVNQLRRMPHYEEHWEIEGGFWDMSVGTWIVRGYFFSNKRTGFLQFIKQT